MCKNLSMPGLDHVQITVESCDEQIHDEMMRAKGAFRQTIQGLKNVLDTPAVRNDQHHDATYQCP